MNRARLNTPEQIAARFPNGPRLYDFRAAQEFGWFVAVAIVTVIAQELLTFDGSTVSDWRVWAVALASATVRAAAGAVLAWIGKRALTGGPS